MRTNNQSQLGPWTRNKNYTHESATPQQNTTSSPKVRKQLILPRVSIIKAMNKIKDHKNQIKILHPIKVKPIELQIQGMMAVSSYRNPQQFDTLYNIDNKIEGKTRTLSFQPPKMSFYNKQKGVNSNKPIFTHTKDKIDINLNESQQQNKTMNKKQISKVDLMVDFLHQSQLQKNEQKYQKITNKVKQYQFSKKRSLLQLLKYLKMSDKVQYQQNQSQRNTVSINKDQIQKYTKRDNAFSSSRYNGYREIVNRSLQGQQQTKYIPYFQVRKSNHVTSRRR